MEILKDKFGRQINYLRLAVTDRCNLRCFYCMPEEGIKYVHRQDLLSFEEMYRMVRAFSDMGISKLRITGGEPFLRNGIMDFMKSISELPGIDQLHITTNGTFTKEFIPQLKDIGVSSINLSLDTLDRERFKVITRRDKLDQVMETYHELLLSGIPVKVNMVVMDGRNTEDIYPMLELAREENVAVRFIEEMPFNGTGQDKTSFWSASQILNHIEKKYEFQKIIDPVNSTSANYQINGFAGTFGVIAAYTRTFCGSCNRIRVTPQGELKTCLYDHGQLSLRDIMRATDSDVALEKALRKAIATKAKDGKEAESLRDEVSESMATIGG